MIGHAEKIWLALLALTALGAWLGESGHAGWPLTITVAALIAGKGHLVIDHYMELRAAHPRFRRALHAFLLVAATLVLISQGAGDTIQRLTTIR